MEKEPICWKMFVELRQQVLQNQRTRVQIMGFKLTFVSASIGLIISNAASIPLILLAVPAIAAVFFDLMIAANSFRIQRLAFYIRNHLEPQIRNTFEFADDKLLWQEFLSQKYSKSYILFSGNLGITFLTVVAALFGIFLEFHVIYSPLLLIVVICANILLFKNLADIQKIYESSHSYSDWRRDELDSN